MGGTRPSLWTSTLAAACLLAVVVYHAQVPSALLERSPAQQPSKLAEEGTRYASGKVFADNQVLGRPCPASRRAVPAAASGRKRRALAVVNPW